MLPRTRRLLSGAPIALPPSLDALAERWWRTGPRIRLAVRMVTVALVLLAGTVHAASSPYGPPVEVWVGARDLQVGEVVTSADVHAVQRPRHLLPDGVMTDPTGSLVAPLPRGAVVTDRHLGDGGLGAVLPDDTVAVAVARDRLPELAVGAHVDLVAATLDGAAHTLAEDAVVVTTDDTSVWLAVEPDAAADVAGTALREPIGAVVRPPEPPVAP